MRSNILAVALLGLAIVVAGEARAEFIGPPGSFDTEPNNTPATADPLNSDIAIVNARLGACLPSSDVGIGSLAAGGGDVDFFSIQLPAGCIVTAVVTPIDPTFTNPSMALLGGDTGGPIAGAGPGGQNNLFGPATVGGSIVFRATANATIFEVADANLANPNIPPQSGRYALTISVVPEPATLALLAAGTLALIRRRR